jgi:hypothetical protein
MTSTPPSCSWRDIMPRCQLTTLPEAAWHNAPWLERHIETLVPQFAEMLEQLIRVLPPLPSHAKFFDTSISRRVREVVARECDSTQAANVHTNADAQSVCQPCEADLATSFFGLSQWSCGLPNSTGSVSMQLLCRLLLTHFDALRPGGHFFLAEASQPRLSICESIQALREVGFEEVDIAWASAGVWMVGARKPQHPEETKTARAAVSAYLIATPGTAVVATPENSHPAHKSPPEESKNPLPAYPPVHSTSLAAARCPDPCLSPSPPPVHPHRPIIDSPSPSPPPPTYSSAHPDVARIVQEARAAARPSPAPTKTPPAPHQAVLPPQSSSASSPAAHASPGTMTLQQAQQTASQEKSTAVGSLDPQLLSKLPQLFARFDPYRTGLLSYAQLQSLCRAVGRPVDDSDDDSSLWWTYQSVAAPDQETGQVGISIEDLQNHFYRAGVWNLRADLQKLNLI